MINKILVEKRRFLFCRKLLNVSDGDRVKMVVVTNRFSKIRAIVFDLDGTVYKGENLVDGVFEAINSLSHHGYEIYFCTNNSTRTRQEIVRRLIHLGIETTIDSIFSAGYAAACYLANAGIKQVSLLGTPGLKNELCAAGLTVVDELDKGQARVVGLDPTINYSIMTLFATLHGKGCKSNLLVN